MRVHAAAAYAAAGLPTEAREALLGAFAGVPYPFAELRPIAIELAEELGVAVPSSWS